MKMKGGGGGGRILIYRLTMKLIIWTDNVVASTARGLILVQC
jgi:hypothetical protein